ncbi:NACHT domain-containing protein [Streptomyces cellulosae]
MRFDLYNLGPREFENLSQAIASAELGPFITLFGPGPDGGREATFEGTRPIQNASTDTWSGLGVLQAKYKETPASPREEASWLIAEIRKEFKQWRTSSNRIQRPDFMLFATNVTLSAVPKTGGIDRVSAVMREECRSLGIAGWAVWHSENIHRFLEVHDGIRTSYSAWILPGDILSLIHKTLIGDRPDVAKAMQSFLARELVKDRYANLDQAGAADDRTIPLASVFVDLPIGMRNEHGQAYEAKCLRTLISVCDAKHSAEEHNAVEGAHDHVSTNRMVLVGGPGQGKSTVSQFLCQLYRARLVKDTTGMRNADVRSTVTQVMEEAEKEDLCPRARRWPIQIPLTRLADQLAKGACRNVLDYIAQRVTESGSSEVTASDVRDWLSAFPWLLILDGLDEVPGSSNRAQVLEHISNFQIEADECNADLVIVATTRPQGYTDEFSPKHYKHYSLAPLQTENALGYGRKLARARYGAAADRVPVLMARLEQAAAEPSTAHLMTTPLQVTIMAVLLDRVGKAPKDRYTLFADYYRVIYERELEKEGSASNLLRDHAADIDAIHADVGLMLQTRSERSGETESRLTTDELNVIIKERLAEEGHTGSGLLRLTEAISKAATDRLVFLVPSREGQVSFEIRSLQEFWAADALMNCGEERIPTRLREMSVSSHWRNVLLFALGRIFANRRTLRDSVTQLVSELNTISDAFGSLQRRALTGSRLAVEILNDGMVRAPRYERILVEQALQLLKMPSSNHIKLLATSITDEGMEVAREFLSTELESGDVPPRAVLDFLGTRSAHGDTWCMEKLAGIYQNASQDEKKRIYEAGVDVDNPTLVNLASECLADPSITVPTVFRGGVSQWRYATVSAHPFPSPPWVAPLLRYFMVREAPGLSFDFAPGLRLQIPTVRFHSNELDDLVSAGFPPEHWIAKVRNFGQEPSCEGLADVIVSILPYKKMYSDRVAPLFPWIIWHALQFAQEQGEPRAAVELIRDGALGQPNDWETLEESWATERLDHLFSNTFTDWRVERKPFAPLVCVRHGGRSLRGTGQRGVPRREISDLGELAEIALSIPDIIARRRVCVYLVNSIAQHSYEDPKKFPLTARQVERLYQVLGNEGLFLSFDWLQSIPPSRDWLSALNRIGDSISIGAIWAPEVPTGVRNRWTHDFASWTGLGAFILSDPTRDLSKMERRLIDHEWERIQLRGPASAKHERMAAIALLHSRPPSSVEEALSLLSHVAEAIRLGELDCTEIVRRAVLDHSEPSQELILGLMDSVWESVSYYEKVHFYDRIVQMQASAPTRISFERMRPC